MSVKQKLPTDLIGVVDSFLKDITCYQCCKHTDIMYEIISKKCTFDVCYDCIEQYFEDTLDEIEASVLTSIYTNPTMNLYEDTQMERIGDTLLVFYNEI